MSYRKTRILLNLTYWVRSVRGGAYGLAISGSILQGAIANRCCGTNPSVAFDSRCSHSVPTFLKITGIFMAKQEQHFDLALVYFSMTIVSHFAFT